MFKSKALKAENQKLREELQVLKQVQESLDEDMIRFSLDEKGVVTSTNCLVEQELGLSDNTVIGKEFLDFVPENSRSTDHFMALKKSLGTGDNWHGAVEFDKQNDSKSWLRSIVEPINNSQKQLCGFIIYATELTRTIENSRQQQDILDAINRSMAAIEFTPHGEILTANSNFLQGMGYTLEEIKGSHHKIFCDPEEVNSLEYKHFWEKLANGEYVSNRFKRIDSSGRVIWLEASYNPIHNDRGDLYKVIKFATIITEQIAQEQAAIEASSIAHQVSGETVQQTEQGKQIIQNTINGMQEFTGQMEKVSDSVKELNTHSQHISELVGSVKSIAEQTNLLALNAAIEAARAGEQGRGFAVVADEVRQLASRTNTTTEEISVVVDKNVQQMSTAVALIEECKLEASAALASSTESGVTMAKIQSGAARVVEAIDKFNQNIRS